MQAFLLNGLSRFLKNGHLPVKLHSSVPPRVHPKPYGRPKSHMDLKTIKSITLSCFER